MGPERLYLAQADKQIEWKTARDGFLVTLGEPCASSLDFSLPRPLPRGGVYEMSSSFGIVGTAWMRR